MSPTTPPGFKTRAEVRKLLKSTHIDEIEKIIERMTAVLEERREDQRKEAEARKAKEAAKEEVLALMAEKGLDVTDFVSLQEDQVPEKPKKNGINYLYRWKENGETFEYTGLSIGVINRKAPNGARFDAHLKETGKKRADFSVGTA